MIVAHGRNPDGGLLLVLGLTRDNCDRLLSGMPIYKKPSDTMTDLSLVIVGGETVDAIKDDLTRAGFLDTSVEVRDLTGGA